MKTLEKPVQIWDFSNKLVKLALLISYNYWEIVVVVIYWRLFASPVVNIHRGFIFLGLKISLEIPLHDYIIHVLVILDLF